MMQPRGSRDRVVRAPGLHLPIYLPTYLPIYLPTYLPTYVLLDISIIERPSSPWEYGTFRSCVHAALSVVE